MDIASVGYEDSKWEQMHVFMDRLWSRLVLVDLSIPNIEHFQLGPMETVIKGNDSFRWGQILLAQIGSFFKSKGDYSLRLNGHWKLKGHRKMNSHKKLNSHPKVNKHRKLKGCQKLDSDQKLNSH
eukprot:Gb_12283 [translate_table: standard]